MKLSRAPHTSSLKQKIEDRLPRKYEISFIQKLSDSDQDNVSCFPFVIVCLLSIVWWN
jgi:hypothetical protein